MPLPKRLVALPVAALLAVVAAACDGRQSPAAPDTRPAAITFENVTTLAIALRGELPTGRHLYRMPFTLRETTGVGAFISQVTATLIESSGATTVAQLSAAEAFGTARLAANGSLVSSGITVTSRPDTLRTVTEMTVRLTFIDDNGNAGSAQTS